VLFHDQNGALGNFQGFNIAPNGSINFMLGSESKFFFGDNGNIGIGTSSPRAKLEVIGTLKRKG
jgi:hypothetical protein